MPLRSLPWSIALRAGSVAYLAATLVVALLLSSYWAGHTNFPGHQHPAGTPEHTHALFQIVGAPSVPAPTIVAKPLVAVLRSLPMRLIRRAPVRPGGAVRARAPPRGLRADPQALRAYLAA